MNFAETLPAPTNESPEAPPSPTPHYEIQGFEKLPPDSRDRYLKIPASVLPQCRPMIEAAIAEYLDGQQDVAEGSDTAAEAGRIENRARPRRDQANYAIETYHRAERGDSDAQEELNDLKRELLNQEPTDEDVFQTVLEDQSGNPFADDLVLEVMLSDEETEAHQRVLDLFKEFRGELASPDSVIKPMQQIELFCELTKGGGTLVERMFFARKALTVVTDGGNRSLFEGLKEFNLLDGGNVVESAVVELRGMTEESRVTPKLA